MNDVAVRALVLSQDERILQSYRFAPELRESVFRTRLAVIESQDLIHRSDRLIRSIAKVFGALSPS